jgi:hypothetical protein
MRHMVAFSDFLDGTPKTPCPPALRTGSTRIHHEFIVRCYHAHLRNMTEHHNTSDQDPQSGRISPLGILAASLALRLTLDELEWLYRELEERTEEKRRNAGEVRVLAGYRDAWSR